MNPTSSIDAFTRLESKVRSYCRSFPVVFRKAAGATLTDSEGLVQWEQDVSEDASPLEEALLPNPSFAQGDWELDIQARGGGESTLGSVRDNFVIIVTITNSCMQYPLVETCE